MTTQPHIFILHVKKGYQDRATHIQTMMSKLGLEFEWILEGDMDDLTPEWLDKYFRGRMNAITPYTSCASKHLIAFKKIIDQNLPGALVLEDDMFLNRNFTDILSRAMAELNNSNRPYYIGFEATCLKLVPRSKRRKGQVAYPADSLQCMGAYYINNACARILIDTIEREKCDEPTDLYISALGREKLFDIYWSHPVVAQQGSHNGKMISSIGNSVGISQSHLITVKRYMTMLYKRILYSFR